MSKVEKKKNKTKKQNKTNGMVYSERSTLLGCASQYKSLQGAPQRPQHPSPTPPSPLPAAFKVSDVGVLK